MRKTNGLISLTATATAALVMTAMAGTSSAAVFPSSPKLLAATVNIIDQQSPIVDQNGNPVTDPDSGLPETFDDTSVNLTASFLGNILQPITPGGVTGKLAALNVGTLNIGIEPAGYCAALAASSDASSDALRIERIAQFFRIPLAELRNVPGGQAFEGLTEGRAFLQAASEATAEVLAPATGATFDSEGPNFFDGDPWANLMITPSLLILPGTLKLDGITDLSSLLGTPRLKVDVVIGAVQPQAFTAQAQAPAPGATPACITVPATVTTVPVEPTEQDQMKQ
jgi:hypothetical protein